MGKWPGCGESRVRGGVQEGQQLRRCLLGLALTGAALAEPLLRRLYGRLKKGSAGAGDAAEERPHARAATLLGLVLAAQTAVCFANPWGWRLAVLPIQTLRFMARHGIAGADYDAIRHPWSVIGEFFYPFAPGVFEESKASYAFLGLLGLAGIGSGALAPGPGWLALAPGGCPATEGRA